MKMLKNVIVMVSIMTINAINAAVLWVGDSPQCNQPNHYDTLNLALFEANINGTEDDEIRLTNTVSYFGEVNGDYRLTNWNNSGSGNGELTIVGGYNDCNGSTSGRTVIGDSNEKIFEITDNSTVILRNIEITLGQKRGLEVSGESNVTLENVDIAFNNGGVVVRDGSMLQTDAQTIVQFNETSGIITQNGGGILCSDSGSRVSFSGRLFGNSAPSGGNIYVANQCFFVLEGGARVEGNGTAIDPDALAGGAVAVVLGGRFFANGGQNRIFITNHHSVNGGAILARDIDTQVTLFNTFIGNNQADEGSAIYALDGGNSDVQILMDRVEQCPLLISCSELDSNTYTSSLVYIDNSIVRISRTLIDSNTFDPVDNGINGMIQVVNNSTLEMDHGNFISNEAHYLIENHGTAQISHITAVDNDFDEPEIGSGSSFAWFNSGTFVVENSIWQQTQGVQNNNLAFGKCNLVDEATGWPSNTFFLGLATFNNVAGGDSRQNSGSIGVDMCQRDSFDWSEERDIENQIAPVNEMFNPQGMPGESGGLYDAGFDEVYDNIGNDEFLLAVQKTGAGQGIVLSTPDGINCGIDCMERYFFSTQVTLFANANSGSKLLRWMDCPLVDASNNCIVNMTTNRNITAEFGLIEEFLLTVGKTGTGTGTITSSPGGINCGNDCTESYQTDTTVTLMGTAQAGSELFSWNNCPLIDGSNNCIVTLTEDRDITAEFRPTDLIFYSGFE